MSTVEKTFSNGEIIIKQGDTGNTFFQLLEGKVGVYKNYDQADQVQVAILEQGQYFGEMAVIENYPRSTTVVAEGDVKVIEIAAEELNEYISQNPDKILEIMKLLGKRIDAMTNDYNEAKKVLDEIRLSNSRDKYQSFFNNMIQQSIFLSAKNFRLEKPSAESLREAAEKVSGQKPENAVTYSYGTIIFKQGEVGKCMYIVHSGSVSIYSNYGANNELKLAEITPVACFGEMGMILDEPRNATAVAENNDTEVEIIRAEDLENLFRSSPEKIDMILKNLSYRLRTTTYEYYKACKEIYEAQKD
ncbi:cyclic nucleotide-binding domain-containing protein [Butyrivibrio sp. AE2032]|uniref:cyclic nucleotide-binding domain-containing protein n=1 Tax=Butyrivibrio sp. AE2032 TaxID=1458463 RepID=UPI00055589BC|nr:cyclic nucleotide-binding domain-containing protein [Butyrivibrio sp. AE2032]